MIVVRVNIPNKRIPCFERVHGHYSTVEDVITDDAGRETGDSRGSHLYTVSFAEVVIHGSRWRDLRPTPEKSIFR